jgi:hypothetical protein
VLPDFAVEPLIQRYNSNMYSFYPLATPPVVIFYIRDTYYQRRHQSALKMRRRGVHSESVTDVYLFRLLQRIGVMIFCLPRETTVNSEVAQHGQSYRLCSCRSSSDIIAPCGPPFRYVFQIAMMTFVSVGPQQLVSIPTESSGAKLCCIG